MNKISGQTDQPYVLFALKASTLSSGSVSRPYSKGQCVTQRSTPTCIWKAILWYLYRQGTWFICAVIDELKRWGRWHTDKAEALRLGQLPGGTPWQIQNPSVHPTGLRGSWKVRDECWGPVDNSLAPVFSLIFIRTSRLALLLNWLHSVQECELLRHIPSPGKQLHP